MSREALGDATADVRDDVRAADDDARAVMSTLAIEAPEPTPAAPGSDPQPTAATTATAPTTDPLDLDLTDPPAQDAGAAAPGPAPATSGTPRRTRLVTAAAGVVLLVVGVLAGATSARQQGQARLDAAARVVVSAGDDQNRGFDQLYGDADTGSQAGDVLQFVTISFVGRIGDAPGVRVERLRTQVGDFDLYPPLTTADGTTAARTLLRGSVNCSLVSQFRTSDSVTGRLFEKAVAVVRPLGSRRDVEVPVIVPNPDATLSSIDARCTPGRYPEFGDSYSVTGLVARADGTLEFLLNPGTAFRAGRDPARLAVIGFDSGTGGYATLTPSSTAPGSSTYTSSDTLWTMTTTPALPLVGPAPVTVTARFTYRCPRGAGANAVLPQRPDLQFGTVMPDGTVNANLDGMDDGTVGNAVFAAAVLACRAAPGRTFPARQGHTR